MRDSQDYAVLTPGQFEDKPGLPTLIPLVAVSLSALPNLNEILYMSPMGRKGAVSASRSRGYKIGLEIARALKIPVVVKQKKGGGKSMREYAIQMAEYTINGNLPIFGTLYIWNERSKKDAELPRRVQDIYNPVVKALIDGLTDSGIWTDDNSRIHRDLLISYKGLADMTAYRLSFYAIQAD